MKTTFRTPAERQIARQKAADIMLFSTLLGAFAAIAFGIAIINAADGKEWAADLMASPTYLYGITGFMAFCIVCMTAAMLHHLRNE